MQRTVEDFAKMRLDVGGMLDPKVYHELYLSARQSAHNILEIGTARGAATVALGLGALDGGHENVRVATVEKLGEGYTERYGTPEDYRARLYGAFERYGVAGFQYYLKDGASVATPPEILEDMARNCDAIVHAVENAFPAGWFSFWSSDRSSAN